MSIISIIWNVRQFFARKQLKWLSIILQVVQSEDAQKTCYMRMWHVFCASTRVTTTCHMRMCKHARLRTCVYMCIHIMLVSYHASMCRLNIRKKPQCACIHSCINACKIWLCINCVFAAKKVREGSGTHVSVIVCTYRVPWCAHSNPDNNTLSAKNRARPWNSADAIAVEWLENIRARPGRLFICVCVWYVYKGYILRLRYCAY
jgi:hypothetical protein